MLSRTTGEDNEALAVGFQAGDVCGKGFGGEIGAAGVDRDTDSDGEFAGDACFLFRSQMIR